MGAKYSMSNFNRSLFIKVALLSGLASSLGIGRADDRDGRTPEPSGPYSVASIHGDYAVVGVFGANVAALVGTARIDGFGRVVAPSTFVLNVPGPNSTRVVISVPNVT